MTKLQRLIVGAFRAGLSVKDIATLLKMKYVDVENSLREGLNKS